MEKIKLLHGSRIKGLKILRPALSDYNRVLLYATPVKAYAAIFINTPGGSLEAAWGKINGKPYYCERIKDVFEKNYDGFAGSIYELDKKHFKKISKLWEDEYACDHDIKILNEIKVQNVKNYLINLQNKNEFLFIPYKDRFTFFPSIDEDLIKNCISLIEKFGDSVYNAISEYYDLELIDKVKKRMQLQ